MTSGKSSELTSHLVAEWPFPTSVAIGSAVRIQGIERELRARLPWPVRPGLIVENGRVTLTMAEGAEVEFENASKIVAGAISVIDALPVLPREVEDILTVTPHERQKWLKDGRLKSIGTRTVKLRGRAKAVTFHVFDPRQIEDLLDRDLASLWREQDAQAIAENRKRAASKAASTRAGKEPRKPAPRTAGKDRNQTTKPTLEGWTAFVAEGLLR